MNLRLAQECHHLQFAFWTFSESGDDTDQMVKSESIRTDLFRQF